MDLLQGLFICSTFRSPKPSLILPPHASGRAGRTGRAGAQKRPKTLGALPPSPCKPLKRLDPNFCGKLRFPYKGDLRNFWQKGYKYSWGFASDLTSFLKLGKNCISLKGEKIKDLGSPPRPFYVVPSVCQNLPPYFTLKERAAFRYSLLLSFKESSGGLGAEPPGSCVFMLSAFPDR